MQWCHTLYLLVLTPEACISSISIYHKSFHSSIFIIVYCTLQKILLIGERVLLLKIIEKSYKLPPLLNEHKIFSVYWIPIKKRVHLCWTLCVIYRNLYFSFQYSLNLFLFNCRILSCPSAYPPQTYFLFDSISVFRFLNQVCHTDQETA